MIILYKPLGITPYQSIIRLRHNMPELKEKKLSYAGRLDPMAKGLLLILEGDENKKRRQFEHYDKTYEFEALLGFSSDSYDLMGMVERAKNKEFDNNRLKEFMSKNKGKVVQEYPPYSSIKVDGKPLYWWAREGKKVKSPKKEIIIKELSFVNKYSISKRILWENIYSTIPNIVGDFRQEEIVKNWKKILEEEPQDIKYQILKFRMQCSSGGYVRSIVNSLGEFLGCGALAFSIERVKIADWKIEDSYSL